MAIKAIHLDVNAGGGKIRLEDFLFEAFPGLSRMYIRDVIKSENCEVNGRVENKGKPLRTGDFVEIRLDLDRETAMRPEPIPLEILFEDTELLVVNKPSGMLVHPTHPDKNGTMLNALVFHLNSGSTGKTIRPGLVHRLDKETSGMIVVAKSVRSHRLLARQFQQKSVEKKYIALVEGSVSANTGTIEAPIGRFAERKIWDVKEGAKPSVTKYRVIERGEDATLLELEPITGRTNQLRIHCAAVGHPIVGDVQRGGREFVRLCLHAFFLKFRHPTTQGLVEFSSESPDEFSLSAQGKL